MIWILYLEGAGCHIQTNFFFLINSSIKCHEIRVSHKIIEARLISHLSFLHISTFLYLLTNTSFYTVKPHLSGPTYPNTCLRTNYDYLYWKWLTYLNICEQRCTDKWGASVYVFVFFPPTKSTNIYATLK